MHAKSCKKESFSPRWWAMGILTSLCRGSWSLKIAAAASLSCPPSWSPPSLPLLSWLPALSTCMIATVSSLVSPHNRRLRCCCGLVSQPCLPALSPSLVSQPCLPALSPCMIAAFTAGLVSLWSTPSLPLLPCLPVLSPCSPCLVCELVNWRKHIAIWGLCRWNLTAYWINKYKLV